MACVMKCSEHPLCDSFNFEEALKSNNFQKCELNYHQNETTCSNHFLVRPGFSYYELDDDKKGMKSMYLFHYMCVFIFTCTCGSGGSKILKAGQWDVKERKTCLVLPRKFLPELVMLFPDFCGNHERHFKRLSNSCGQVTISIITTEICPRVRLRKYERRASPCPSQLPCAWVDTELIWAGSDLDSASPNRGRLRKESKMFRKSSQLLLETLTKFNHETRHFFGLLGLREGRNLLAANISKYHYANEIFTG